MKEKENLMAKQEVSIPSNGSSLFQWEGLEGKNIHPTVVSIPSNGSSLFQSLSAITVYLFLFCLNPLKRVKFISIIPFAPMPPKDEQSLNPLKRVKFISIKEIIMNSIIKWIVSIPSNGSSLFQ